MKGFMRQRGVSWELRVFLGRAPLASAANVTESADTYPRPTRPLISTPTRNVRDRSRTAPRRSPTCAEMRAGACAADTGRNRMIARAGSRTGRSSVG